MLTDCSTNDKNLPSISVVIAAHNGENYLAETLRSVLSQTLPASEILVVDDGSTDDTAGVARSFGEKVQLITREKSGVSASRNYGISVANNEWVALLDHDDLWEPDHLENFARMVVEQPETDVCYSGTRRMVADPETGAFHLAARPNPMPTPENFRNTLMDHCFFTPSAAMVRRTSVVAVGGFDGYFIYGQDWDLWLRMLHAGCRFAYSGKPTLLYRVHRKSHSHRPEAIGFYKDVVRRNVLPYMPWPERLTRGQRAISELENEAALRLRSNGRAGALKMMLQSILRSPFHSPLRYKIAAHMLLRGYKVSS
jgi:glycosyltransferase involved in cell wall biosynthesis